MKTDSLNSKSDGNGTYRTASPIANPIYPNPTNGVFTIDMPDFNKDAIITIFDLLGKLIERRKTNGSNKEEFNLSNYPCGEYIAHVFTDEKTYSVKFILK